MAPSEETATATCSQQQKQDVAGAKIQQDSPKIQQDAPAKREEDVNRSPSPSRIDQVIDGLQNATDCGDSMNHSPSPSCVDTVTDGHKSVTTDCAENVDSLVESQDSTNACVNNCKPHVNGQKSGFSSCIGNTDSVIDRRKKVDTTCKEDIDDILDSSQNVANTEQVVDDPDNSVTTAGNFCQAGDSPKSVVVADKRNDDQILDGPKEVAADCVETTDQVVTSAKGVAATCLNSVINESVVNPHVDSVVCAKEDEVVDDPESVACASIENTAEVTDKPENKADGPNAISRVENMACVVSVTKQQVTNMSIDDASHVSVASKVVDMETANEGCGGRPGVADEDQSCDGDDSVREQCLFLLKELVSQADEVAQQRRDGAQHMECGPLWCRLPVSKVSEALKFCRSSTNSALVDNKQSSTKQYTTCDSHHSYADEPDIMQNPANENRMKEMGASSSILPLYPSPPDSFAEESTPPPMFQGHRTMTVDLSLPSTPEDSSEDSPLGDEAVLLFTPTCMKIPGSPSIASVTHPSDTVLGPLCVTPCSSSSSLKANKHDAASSLVMAEQKPQHPSTIKLPAPQRFLFQLEPVHLIKMSDGQKLFACDICCGVYQRSFSLKRHFLRTHINHRYLTERDISNCCIIVSERYAKEKPSGSSVEKKSVAVVTDVNAAQGSPDSVTKNSSSDKCSTVNPKVENDVIFPNLYCCHSCSICFDAKDELRYHLSTYKHAAATSKEKTATKPVSGSQKARSKSLPNLKKGSKLRDRSMSASSQELSSLAQVPAAHGQLICESAILAPGHISGQVPFSQMSSFLIRDHSVVTPGLPKSTANLSSRSLGSGHSSKHLPSGHTSKCDCSSEASTPDCSLKHMPSDHSSNSYISDHLLKPVSPVHLSKPSSPDHSSKSSSSRHSKFSLSCHSTNPSSSSHSLKQALPGHSSNLARPEFISSAITKHTVPDQLSGSVISKQSPANIGHFAKPISSEKLLKSSDRGQVLCLYCDKSFSTPTLHKRHVSRSHPHAQLSLQNKTPPHKCAYCIKPGGTFRELPLLVQHLLATHPDLYHVCTTCELRFDSKQALDHHQTLVHHGDCRWNSACTTIPLQPFSQTLMSDANTAGKSSQSAPDLPDGSRGQTSIEGSVDLLGSGGEFLYTCSVCRQVFNDYVAMCRHHRQVHKGKRSLNSVVQGVGSPASVLDNRSQSPFVMPEKGLKDQVQDKKDPEGNVDEQRMTSDVTSTKPVNSSICRTSESESETNAIKLSCKRQGIETKDFVSETVKGTHWTTDLSKTEPKNEISNVAQDKCEENVGFITFPSIDAGDGVASSLGVPHCPAQFPMFGSNTHQVDVFSSCADRCVSHSLDVSNIVSRTADKIGPHTNSCEFTVQITERNEVSACGGSNFAQKSGSNPQVFGTLDAKTTSDHVLNKQKYNCILKSPLKSMFEDISDQSEDSVDLHKLETSMCVEPSSNISLVGTADYVKTMPVNKCVDLNLVVNPTLGSEHEAAAAKTPDCIVDSSEPPTGGTLWPFKTCSESSLADTSASHRTSPASMLNISDPTEIKPNCLTPGISDPLEVSSDTLQLQTPVSVDEKSEMFTNVISDSEDKLSLTKNKNSAKENLEIMSVVPEASESVTESCQYSMEESFHSLVAETIDSTVKIPEFSFAEPSGCVVENFKSLPGGTSETSSDCREISCNRPPDETAAFLEERPDAVLKKVSDSVEDNIKFSLGEISDHARPVICDPKDSVKPSLGVILNSAETVNESSLTETLDTLEQAASLSLTGCSNFTEEISDLVLEDDLNALKGSGKQSSSSTEECDKSTLPDSLHSIEWPSKLSLVDTSDSMQEEISEVSLAETAGAIRSSNASLTEISDSMESCSKGKFCETANTDESTVMSSDDVADDMESSSKLSLHETLNSTEESRGLVEVISNSPHLAAEGFKFSVTESFESLEGNEKTELTDTSYSLEEHIQSPVMERSEEILEPLLIETSAEQTYCPAVTVSPVSVEEDSKCAPAETTDLMQEISNSSSPEIVDLMEENSKSVKEVPDSLEENSESTLPESSGSIEVPESFNSVGEGSKSISMESFDSVKENHKSEFTGSSGFVEEGLKSILTDNLDSVKEDLKLVSAEVSDSLEENYKAALTEDCESMRESPENSEHLTESSQSLLSPSMCCIETDSKLSSNIIERDSDAVQERLDSVRAKSKSSLSVTQSEGEGVSGRTLRSNSAHLTKSFDPSEENDSIPLSQRLLQSKNDAAISDQAAVSGRVLRKSSAVSAVKPIEVVVDSEDQSKGDSNRAVRRSAASKNDESSVDQEVTGDAESGVTKSRPKASLAAVRRTRLRKFSRRVKGDQVQEEQHLDPETLFYCQIAGNIQENLLHHLDGKLEHEVRAKSQDLNNTSLSQPHTSVTTGHEEKHNHRHHHRTPWEKFNFPKKYDGRCREGTVCLASYIKDMSHLDISTQLTMQQNLQRLGTAPAVSRSSVDISAEISKDDVIGFSRGLCLSAKVCADRRRSLRSAANRGRDALLAAPGGAASTFTASASLKRWSSADDVAAAESVVELSGEWVRPRSYICAACGVMFNDLWDLEDHKHSQHPNVWCTHYEFEQADLDQAVDTSKSQCGGMSSKDFCRRFLLVREAAEAVPPSTLSSEVRCTKCERGFNMLPELHRHILECGGDTTWMLLPSPNSSGRRTRKWRPFGSRRRRQQGSHRRGMKRNIPTTPVKQYFRARHRSVAGDSIQRMLANLPAKRSTRRVIQFSEDEIKTRSQGTMHSVSFASGVVRTSHKTGHRVVQSLQVRAPTADTNDTVYRKLAIRTPKKLPGTPSVAPAVSSEQTSAPKPELPSKKLPQSKSQPLSSVPQSKSTGCEIQKKGPRVGRSLSPVASKSESLPLNDSEETKLPSLHKSRSRSKKPVSPQTCSGLNEPSEANSMGNSGSGTNVQEFDMDVTAVGSTETSNILAAMRIAMLEGVITNIPPSGPSIKKLTKKVSVKKHPSIEENKAVVLGKRKKLESCQQNSVKKKTKLSQSELEERFLRNKGYTHPDEVTDEPIICKGCGLQFDSGSAELRHRKTCIYVPSQEDGGLNEVEDLHSCLLSCVQSPSRPTVLKHSEQFKGAVSSNTEVTGELSACRKKTTTVKAKSKTRDNSSSITAVGKQENTVGLKKSPGSNSENCTKIGRTKVKPRVTNIKKQITKRRNISNSRIIKGDVGNNLDALKKGLTGAENTITSTSTSTMKQKVDSVEIVSCIPVETQRKPGTESTSSCPARKKKKVDISENPSSSPVGTKKKIDNRKNASSSSLGIKQKVDSAENTSSSPGRTNKKIKDTQIIRNETVRPKTKSGSHNRIVVAKKKVGGTENAIVLRTERKLDGTEGAISNSAGIVRSVANEFAGVKKKSKNSENYGSGLAVPSKKQGNIGRTVSSSLLGGRKKLGSIGKHSPVRTKRKSECTENVNVGQCEIKPLPSITHSNSSNLVMGKEECDQSETERTKKQMDCDGIVLVTETVDNNATKMKKRSATANIVSTARKKGFGSSDLIKGGKKKSGNTESMHSSTDKRKHECCSNKNESHSPASSDMDDKMPELQKEEPIENMKTETPSPKVEDLCDIPILSPVGCEPLGEDCEEKKNGDILTKDITNIISVVEEKEGQPLPVEGKKQSKGTVKNCAGLRQTAAAIKTRKSSAMFKKKDVRHETLQIPLHIEPSKQEASVDTQVAKVEAGGVISQGEMDSDDKPLAECFGACLAVSKQSKETLTCDAAAATTTDKDETRKVLQENDIEKSESLSKQHRHKPVRHRNSTPLCDGKDKKVATKPTVQLTEEDSNDDLLPIAKLKEVIQKKILPLKELDSNTSAAHDPGCLNVHMNSEVTQGPETKSLAERNVPVVITPGEVFKSKSSVQHGTEEPPEISDHVSLAEKGSVMSRRAALKRGKRGRTQSWHQDTRSVSGQHQSQAYRKASLPVGVLEIPASEGAPTGIRSKVEKLVISKKKARKYTEQAESQNTTQMENLKFVTGHGREESSLCFRGQDVEGKTQVGTKRKTKRKVDKMQSGNGESVKSPVSKVQDTIMDLDNETDFLAGMKHKTNISGVGKKKEDPLLQCEETGSGIGKKLLVTRRKVKRPLNEFRSEVAVVASSDGLMNDAAAASVGKSKKANQFVSEGHQTKMSGTDEESKEIQSRSTSCLTGKKSEIAGRTTRARLEEIRSQCIDNGHQTDSSKQRGETDYLDAERVAENEGTNPLVGKRLVVTERKSQQQMKESESNDGRLAYSGISQRQDSNTVIGKAGLSDCTDVHVFVCKEEEMERQVREQTDETVLSCREVTSVSICEEVKVRRRKQTNLTDMSTKAVHLIDNNKEVGLDNRKKANLTTHKTKKTRQNIKLVRGKRREVSPTEGEEQIHRLIVDEDKKRTINTEKDEASILCVEEREIGDGMEMDKDSRKDKLSDVVVEAENTSTSVADTDSRMDLICDSDSMNVLGCDTEKATNISCDETDDATNDLSTEGEDTGTFVCLREETSDLVGGKEHTQNLTCEKESSSRIDENNTSGPTFHNEEGLMCHVERMDSVETSETKDMDYEKEYRVRLTEDREEINGEVLGSDMVIDKERVPVKSGHADSLVCQESCLNPVIIQQGEMNGQVVQMGSSLLAINTVGSTKVEESQAGTEGPLRQARRTRCNTSYEELYTWSDVTSETEEESSQDLPDASVMAALCQNTSVSTCKEIAAMIANGDFFPSSSKKKKKKKLRNNSRQYRNGHLRRKRHKKQKLRTRLMKKPKRSAVNEFIVTDIETGHEESQDSCESLLLAPAVKMEHQPVDTETHTKPTDTKKKKKRAKTSGQRESEEQATSNESVQVSDSSKPKQKRKSSVGSVFFCTLCNKHYSTNYNLMKHKMSLVHKRMCEKDQSAIPTDGQNTEHEHWPLSPFQNTESEKTSPVEQILETELLNSDSPSVEVESSHTLNHSLETAQESSCLAAHVEMEQLCSSVQNTEFENSCSSAVQSVTAEHPCSSDVLNVDADHHSVAENINAGKSCVVLSANTVCEEQCSVAQNVEGEELCATEAERTYTLMQNMEVEQFSTCIQSTSLPERQAAKSSMYVSKPATSRSGKGHMSQRGSPVQNSALDGGQQGTSPVQTLPAVGPINETAATGNSNTGVFFEQPGVCIEHQENVTSDWVGKERDIQQNMNAVNWQTSGEVQKQAGWFEGQVDNNQWLYTGQWPQEMAWGREVNSSMNWNADTNQEDGTFFQSNSASLGSILDSVNQILDNERSAHGLSATAGYQPYVGLVHSGTADVDPGGGLRELQQAMGATDEEMAMLQQLGEGSWPLEDADIMDLDNQKSDNITPTVASMSTSSTPTNTAASTVVKLVEGTMRERTRGEEDGNAVSSVAMAQAAVTTRAFSGRGGLRTQDIQLARYESKDMVCPVCSRRFLGLTALRAHLAAAHNSSTRHRTQAIKRPRIVPSSSSDGSEEPTRHVCLVCKELLPDEQGLADHVAVAHVERQNSGGRRPDGMGGSNHTTSGGGDEGLRSHMTSALGGLLTRALNNFLGKNRSQPSPPATQIPSPSAGSSGDSRSSPLLTQPIARLLGRGLKMTNRRHSSGPADELPFGCVDCDERFSSESNRNRHKARAHRGHHHRRLSTDSPLELTRLASPLTSSESTVSEVDTDSMPLSVRMSNSSSQQRPGDSEPCRSQLITASTVDRETSMVTKENCSSVKDVSDSKGESCSVGIVPRTDHCVGTPGNSGEEEQERATIAVTRSTDMRRVQDQGRLTQWRNSMKSESSQLRPEGMYGMNDEESIKAKAVAALRALNARDKRIRNGLPGTIGAALWSGASRKKSKGVNGDDRFRFPLVRKTPPSSNRFASLVEKKKKYISSAVKFEAISQPKECPEEERQEVPAMPLNAAIPFSYDIYEFQDEVEQNQRPSELRLRTPVEKVGSQDSGADTGPSSDLEESRMAEWDSPLSNPHLLSEQKGEECTSVEQHTLENPKRKLLKSLTLSEQNSSHKTRFKRSHSSRKRESSKKKRWHRIIVDSGDDTSDTETVAEPHNAYRVAGDHRLSNRTEGEKYVNSDHQIEEGRGVKRRRVLPCLSGVLVEDRQYGKRAKTAKQPSKGSSRRSTKTDLLMSVFAKSRQRNSYINAAAAGHSVSAQPPFCSTSFSGSYRSVGTFGNIAEAESESDSGSLATSVSTGNLAMSSDDERMVRGRKPRKQKREKRKITAL